MITPESNGNNLASVGASVSTQDTQIPKKTALRDVQNENVGSTNKLQDSPLPGVGKSNGDAIKVCGTKRLTPERPSISQGLSSKLAQIGANENVMNARRRFELELGKGRAYSNVEKSSDLLELKSVAQKSAQKKDSVNVHHVTAAIGFPSKQVNSTTTAAKVESTATAAKVDSTATAAKVDSTATAAKVDSTTIDAKVDSKVNGDQVRAERFIRLQNFLKQCDEANQREHNKRLMRLSPSNLSKHAVELEKRAIQLTIDEGNEMQRMKALNILAKASPTNNLLQSSPSLQSDKR